MATRNHTTSTTDTDPVSATLAGIDDLLCRYAAQAETVAKLRRTLADLHDERTLREAQAQLDAEGKNEQERAARLRTRLACDADYQRCREAEKDVRVDVARAEAALFVTRQRLAVCLALLRLVADTGDTGDVDGADAMPARTEEEDPS